MADFSLPVPPKDDFRLMISKDFPISDSLGSSTDLSNSISFGFKEVMSEPLTLSTNNTFSGAKPTSKISPAQPSVNIDPTCLDTNASGVENEPKRISHSDKSTKHSSWWSSLGKLKTKKQSYSDTRIKPTADVNSNPASNPTFSASSSPTSLINDGNHNVQNLSKAKKLNIKSKLQKFGHKKTKVNESSNITAEEYLTQTTGLSTMSTGKPENDKNNNKLFVERLDHSHSFTSDPRPPKSHLGQIEKPASLTNPPK
ncbi:15317_t:CDS:1, partial [Racocetra fulgida]